MDKPNSFSDGTEAVDPTSPTPTSAQQLSSEPAQKRQNPSMARLQTAGRIYDMGKSSQATIDAERGKAAERSKEPDPRSASDLRRLVEEAKSAPEDLLGINVKAYGIDVKALHYGNVSTKVDGKSFDLGAGKVTVNAEGEITSVKVGWLQVTKDGRGIVQYKVGGFTVTGGIEMAAAFKTSLAHATERVANSRVGDAGEMMKRGSTEQVEARLKEVK